MCVSTLKHGACQVRIAAIRRFIAGSGLMGPLPLSHWNVPWNSRRAARVILVRYHPSFARMRPSFVALGLTRLGTCGQMFVPWP